MVACETLPQDGSDDTCGSGDEDAARHAAGSS
jgi:hypothetical protein